ncbi:NitT/TauT family transport system substrate-binding protein [Herbaspirillum sp. Sphag1AN]|uniref:ABC transporter substrate-binding protein n=1 Tax=unclassified Herbaspirillum TaxID=2624150 RepID=UPI0017E995C5|nr:MULTISPECIES: ABC transporter substrate-binding protein [unclassified Herbaspirillum]MBB3211065.1 NitT/TauT family transport system substrate-binding protein [Herbaspirillum sp. Sphag1AN]MBB3244694.1 NitT/TauT family transport system substrate-binding protein [Herbaspirillum sp. Sphag64]
MTISKCIKKFLFSVVLGSCCAAPLLPAVAADKVKFNLAWLPQGSTGGILVAIAKGFYAEAGLDVTAVRGYGGQRTVNEIDQGLFEFGYGDPISVMLNRAQGGKTVMVGTINTRWPGALCYLERADRKLQKPADLKGLSLGGGAASPLQNIVPSWLQANKLPVDQIKLLRLDPSVINSSFLEGRIDLAECWEGANKPILEALAQRDGKKLGVLRYRDFNLNLYGNGIVTSEQLVASNPDLVKRFVQATYRGYAYQRSNPKESADAIASQQKLIDKNILLQQITETNQIIDDPEAENKKLGWMRADRMQSTVDFVKKAFNLQAPVKPNDIYTNKFVE